MKREFLEGLGLEAETVDKILAEKESDTSLRGGRCQDKNGQKQKNPTKNE